MILSLKKQKKHCDWSSEVGLGLDIAGMPINNVPAEIVNKVYTHSLQGFAGYIKTKMLQLYEETCTLADCYMCSRN